MQTQSTDPLPSPGDSEESLDADEEIIAETDASKTEPTITSDEEKTNGTEQGSSRGGFFQRYARSMARQSWRHFLGALMVSLTLSVIGMVVGNFSVAVDNAGWTSRGTLIANRHTQAFLVTQHDQDLLYDDTGALWEDLINNVQPGWEESEGVRRRRLESVPSDLTRQVLSDENILQMIQRHLQNDTYTTGGALEGCDLTWYTGKATGRSYHLWPIWKTKNAETSILDAQVLHDVCVAEQNTQQSLQEAGLCYGRGCTEGRCYPPFSMVMLAHLAVGDTSIALSCSELKEAWSDRMDQVQTDLETCVQAIGLKYEQLEVALEESCPFGFSPHMVDEFFGQNGEEVIRYSSSVFATTSDSEALYEQVSEFDRATWSQGVRGAYDTEGEDFIELYLDEAVGRDMLLAVGSAFVTAIAMVIHTRSPWLATVGLIQIVLSFPLAYFVYNIVAGLEFFPFLNFIGIFVVFALGADDVFVAVDKWKNARLEYQSAPAEDIAAIALPDAAGSMFLTSITTAVAFFGTAICPVAPLKCFAVFCGLLIVFDYLMCIFLVFPALCIYDKWLDRGVKNCCVSCHYCARTEAHEEEDGAEARPSLIRRILKTFYNGLHFCRWPLLVLCVAALVVCILVAMQLGLPESSDVRLLEEDQSQFEQNYVWRLSLLSTVLWKQTGSRGTVIWGVRPADTGDHNNPAEWSQLVLDDTFDPSSEASQVYLTGFCDDFFSNEFASPRSETYLCPMNAFDNWLQQESSSSSPSDAYLSNCGGATGIPVAQEVFSTCIKSWSLLVGNERVLGRDGKVEIMSFDFVSRVRYDSPYDDLDRDWNALESWMKQQQNEVAPDGVDKMYFSSDDFWWYDTNGAMLRTAYGAAAIALAAAAVVVLVSSRSIMLCIFSLFTIGYVLTSVTAMLVGIGWTLGFLESILFAILIGVSCDFVIHFGHAYVFLPGQVSRHERTEYALIRMGPSILAAAFTTVASAVVMIFTIISFFRKFAVILFFTILQATIGSFVVFLTLSDCFGPSEPTYLVDMMARKLKLWLCRKRQKEAEVVEAEQS